MSTSSSTQKVSEITRKFDNKPSKFDTIFAKFSSGSDSVPRGPKTIPGRGRRGSLPAKLDIYADEDKRKVSKPVFPPGFTPHSSPVSSWASIREGPMSPKNSPVSGRNQRGVDSPDTMSPCSIGKPQKTNTPKDYLEICSPSQHAAFKKHEVDTYLEQLEKVKFDFGDFNNHLHQEITKVVDAHAQFAQRFFDIDADSSIPSESQSESTIVSSETESMYDIRILHEEISKICSRAEDTDQESSCHFESDNSLPSPQRSELELNSPYRKKTGDTSVDDFENVLAQVSERMMSEEKSSFDSMFEKVDIITHKSESFEKVQIDGKQSFDSDKIQIVGKQDIKSTPWSFSIFVDKVDVVDHKNKSLLTFDPNVKEIEIEKTSMVTIEEGTQAGNDSAPSLCVFNNPSIVDQTTNSSFSTVVGHVEKAKTMRTVASDLSLEIACTKGNIENIRASLEVQCDAMSLHHNTSTASLPLLEKFVDKIESCPSMKIIKCEHEIMERSTAPSVDECTIAFPTPPKTLRSLRKFVPKEDGSSAREIIIGSIQFDVPDVPNPDEPQTPVKVSDDEIEQKSRRKKSKNKKKTQKTSFPKPDVVILKNKWMLRAETN